MPLKIRAADVGHPKTAYWYSLYTRSERWLRIKEKKFKQVGKICEICKSKERIVVHHKTYERVTYEKMDDLQILCRECHSILPHDSYHVPFVDRIYDDKYIDLRKVAWAKGLSQADLSLEELNETL